MSINITITGDAASSATAEGDEQSLIDDLVGVLAKHKDKITLATGEFDYQGTRDLLAEANGEPSTGGGGGEPVPVPSIPGFENRVAGESYEEAQARLFTYNSQHAGTADDPQAPTLTREQWDSIVV